MTDPLETLRQEHRIIERVLAALETAATRVVPPDFYGDALDFITQFADGSHHAKEEQLLFPALAGRGFPPELGPVAVMLTEHDVGRKHVDAMQDHLAAGDIGGLRSESLAYTALMRAHIQKEDEVLFELAAGVLDGAAKKELAAAFACVTLPPPGHDGFTRMADRLLDDAGRAAIS